MRWAEISIETRCGATEQVASIASDYSPSGVAIIDPEVTEEAGRLQGLSELELSGVSGDEVAIVRFYASDDEAGLASMLSELRQRLATEVSCCEGSSDVVSISVRMADESEWSGWKQAFKPFRLTGRIVVSPDGKVDGESDGCIVITIDPGQAFGTGQHPTTAGCAALLESAVKGGERVLDIGTGTGILAIAAAKLGATEVLAIDIDPIAVRCSNENIARNGVAEIVTSLKGDLLKGVDGKFDIILANILAGPVIEISAQAAELLKEGGVIITSGYVQKSEEEVVKAMSSAGLDIVDRFQEQDWVAIAAARKSG